MSQSSTLTLTGDVYSFCRIDDEQQRDDKDRGPRPAQPPLRIYMDTPENCGGGAGMGSVSLNQTPGSRTSTATRPPFLLAVSGSAAKATERHSASHRRPSSQMVMGIYAPFSTVTCQLGGLVGAMVAKQVQLNNSVKSPTTRMIQRSSEDALLVYRTAPTTSSAPNLATTTATPTPAAELPMRPGNSSSTGPGSSSALLRRAKPELRQ